MDSSDSAAPGDDTAAVTPPRYRAFLSYSHRDARIAQRLHRRLESFRLPAALRAQMAAAGRAHRLGPVFRDREELASATRLSDSIEAALDASDALIVVCSPAAAASRWVGQEIATFRLRHPQRPVFAFVVAGDPGADPRANPAAAIPLALRLFDPADTQSALIEPLAADARRDADGFGAAFLKLAAGLLDLRYDDLRRREARRRQQRWSIAFAAALSLAAAMAWLAWDATVARDAARSAQARAELELASERQTRGFLLSVFDLADAERSRGEQVTVREVLDRAVARIDGTPFARPAIRSRFEATMGRAYSSLGLFKRSAELLRASLATLPASDLSPEVTAQREESAIELADVLYGMGDYQPALDTLDAMQASTATDSEAALRRARAANVRGDVLAYLERDAEAAAAYADAIALLDGVHADADAIALVRARSFGGRALLHHYAGEYAEAQRDHAAGIETLLASVGELHPATSAAIASHGASAYAAGDSATARKDWERALELARRLYADDGPEIGTIKNNLGLLHLETGDLAEAETLLRAALHSDRLHRSDTFDDLAYPLNNLAQVRRWRGDAAEARTLWDEALPIAEAADHPMLSPILAGLADLDCDVGDAAAGLARAERAEVVAREQFDADHWRVAIAELVLARCRVATGAAIDRDAVVAAAKRVQQRWKPPSPFNTQADALRATILRSTQAR